MLQRRSPSRQLLLLLTALCKFWHFFLLKEPLPGERKQLSSHLPALPPLISHSTSAGGLPHCAPSIMGCGMPTPAAPGIPYFLGRLKSRMLQAQGRRVQARSLEQETEQVAAQAAWGQDVY